MATYRNGIETRELLYVSARKNFSSKGYFNTSIKDIVTSVNSKLGLFTYYFESKESLALDILYELKAAIYQEIDRTQHMVDMRENALVTDMAHKRIWLELLWKHPNAARFACEIGATNAYLAHNVAQTKALLSALYQAQPDLMIAAVKTDENHAKLAVTLMAGMMMQFSHDLPSLQFDTPVQQVIERFFSCYYAQCIESDAVLQDAIAQSRNAVMDVRLDIDDEFGVGFR